MSNPLVTRERVLEEVRKSIVETSGIDEATVRPECSLIRDLGLESLDLLDINYRLEQRFGVKMARRFIIEHMENMFGEGSAVDPDGRLTEKAVQLLRLRLGEELPAEIVPGMDMDDAPKLITVNSLTANVGDMLETLPAACACGASAWACADGMRVKCSACGASAAYRNGDELINGFLKKAQEEHRIF